MFGLDVDTLRNIRKTIAQFPHIEKVLIYGSRAKGNYKAGSDIDITLVAEDLTLKNSVYPLSTALDKLHLPYTFDISIFDQLENPDFVDHILRVGKTFYQKENNVRKGWKETTIGDVCEILDRRRKPITKRNRISGPYPYYGATGIVDYVEGYLFDEPLVLVGEDGAKWDAGENSAFAVNGRCWVNNHAHVLRPNRSILLDNWLIYYLNQSDLTPFITGLTVPKLNQAKLCGISITLPPLPEQKRIVAVLDEAFAAIAAATANTKENIANAQELFDSELNRVFSHEKDAVTPPAGWSTEKLTDLSSVQTGKWNANHAATDGSFRFFTCAYEPFLCNTSRFLGKCLILPGNGVNVGEVFYYDGKFDAYQRTYVISEIQIDVRFLFYHLKTFWRTRNLDKQFGSATNYLKIGNFEDYDVSYPSLPEQKRIATFLDKLSAEKQTLVETYKTKVRALAELKQSLLHQAFTGELTADTKAADRSLSEARV